MTRTLTTTELDYLKSVAAHHLPLLTGNHPPQRLLDLGLVVSVATATGPSIALTATGNLVLYYATMAHSLEEVLVDGLVEGDDEKPAA